MATNGKELARWPFSPLWTDFEQRLAQLNREFMQAFGNGEKATADAEWAPDVDLHETDGAMEVTASLPGVARDDLQVEFEDEAIAIRGEKKAERDVKDEGYRLREVMYGAFYRRLPLPALAQTDKVEAELKDGVLRVTIPKRIEARPKSVAVKVA